MNMNHNHNLDLFETYWNEQAEQLKKDSEDYQKRLRRVIIFLILVYLLMLIVPASILLFSGHYIGAAIYSLIFFIVTAFLKF